MSDVIDIITKLSYQAELSGLNGALSVLNSNINAVAELSSSIDKLKSTLSKLPKSTDPSDIQIRKQIIAQINEQKQALEALIAANKRYAIDNQAQLQKEIGIINALNTKIAQLTVLRNESNDISKIHAFNKELEETLKIVSKISSTKQAPIDYSNVTEGLIGKQQGRLTQLREALPFANTKREIAEINKEIQKVEQSLAGLQTLGKRAFSGNFLSSINDSRQALTRFGSSAQSANLALINVGRIAQDLPFGFLGISNNLNPLLESFQRLKAETGSSGAAMKALGASMIGAGGLGLAISIISGLLIVFGDKLFSSGNESEKAAEKIKKETDAVKELNKALEDSIDLQNKNIATKRNNLNIGLGAAKRDEDRAKAGGDDEAIFDAEQKTRQEQIRQNERDYENFKNASNKLADIAQRYIDLTENGQKKLDQTDKTILREGVTQVLKDVFNYDDAKASAESERVLQEAVNARLKQTYLFYDDLVKIGEDIKNKEAEILNATTIFNRESAEKRKRAAEEAERARETEYKNALEEVENQGEILELNDDLLKLVRAQYQSSLEIADLTEQSRSERGEHISEAQLKLEKEEFDREQKRLEYLIETRKLVLKRQAELAKLRVAEQFNNEGDIAKFSLSANELDIQVQKAVKERPRDFIDPSNTSVGRVNKKDLSKAMLLGKRAKSETEVDTNEFKDKTKENLDKTVEIYRSFEQSVISVLNNISERQIALLDREINVRRDRVNEAVRLAEYGNAEVLKQEQERLDAAQKKREEIAKKQLQINALMQASSAGIAAAQALQTVTNAGSTGDPYTTALRIAAAVAALVAGFAAVRGAFDTDSSFAEGVVDYKGKGTEKSDSNIVRISRGESVITAEATERYKPVLEMMNRGLPITLPYPVSKKDNYRSLEKRLDALIALQEGNGINIQSKITNGHIATIVESQKRHEKSRWS